MGNGPLKSYAKQILEEQKQAYVQFGINQKKVTGIKAFEGVSKPILIQWKRLSKKNKFSRNWTLQR